MMISDTVVIGGEMILENTIDGDLSLESILDGECGIFTEIVPDAYLGPTVVIPRVYEQTLETYHKTMPDDVTVRKIPKTETHNESGITVYIG